MAEFEVFVSKADFKFNCAHFIAFDDFRERLHGHNYVVSVKVVGGATICHDGYVIDFGDIKKITRKLCKDLNEYFICPMKSTDMQISEEEGQICLRCNDGSKFSFPTTDCALLPIYHSSAEEMSHYLWCAIVRKIGLEKLLSRNIKLIEVSVAEAPNQSATYRAPVPQNEEELTFAEQLKFAPKPCFQEE